MNIILFGPPGAGKGTQSQFLVKNFKFNQISTGDLLRSEINSKSKLGIKISEIIDKGNLVSDELIFDILDMHLNKIKNLKNIIFDGYPRNFKQIKEFEKLLLKHKLKINKILYLNVAREILQKRISGRVICSKCKKIYNIYVKDIEYQNHKCGNSFFVKRNDDDEKTILNKVDPYDINTALVSWLELYEVSIPYDGKVLGVLGDQLTFTFPKK